MTACITAVVRCCRGLGDPMVGFAGALCGAIVPSTLQFLTVKATRRDDAYATLVQYAGVIWDLVGRKKAGKDFHGLKDARGVFNLHRTKLLLQERDPVAREALEEVVNAVDALFSESADPMDDLIKAKQVGMALHVMVEAARRRKWFHLWRW